MKKKEPFLPTKVYGNQLNKPKPMALEEPFIDFWQTRKAMMPDRATEKNGPKWNLQKTCDGNFFNKTSRQEDDVYDTNYLKYMRTLDRGMSQPKPLGPLFVQQRNKTPLENYKTNTFGNLSHSRQLSFVRVDKGEEPQVWRQHTEHIWSPNRFDGDHLQYVHALNDNTMSKEEANRAIQCDRSHDKYAWMYTRRNLEVLDSK